MSNSNMTFTKEGRVVVYFVSQPYYSGQYVTADWSQLGEFIYQTMDAMDMGAQLVVTLGSMSREDLEALPEFDGF